MTHYLDHHQLYFENLITKTTEKDSIFLNEQSYKTRGDTVNEEETRDKEKTVEIKKGDVLQSDKRTPLGRFGTDDFDSGFEIDLEIDSDIFSDGETLYDPGVNLFPESEEQSEIIENQKGEQTDGVSDHDISEHEDNDKTTEEDKGNLERKKELNTLYKKYKNRKTKSEYQKSLNKTKIFLVTKCNETLNGNFTQVVLPINNLDDLSNSISAKSIEARVGAFQMLSHRDLTSAGLGIGRPGNRPFILEHALEAEGPYSKEPEVPIEALNIETYGSEKNGLSMDEIIKSILEDTVYSTKTKIVYEIIKDDEGVLALYQSDIGNFEYDHTFVDNTLFTNVGSYTTEPRDRTNYKRGFKEQLNNFKSINLEDIWYGEKRLKTPNEIAVDATNLIHKNTTELSSKNIIPVFSNLEDAQDLLLSILEELLEPYRKTRPIKGFVKTADVNFMDCTDEEVPMTNTEYFDDSFTLLNKIFPTTRLEKFKHFLVKYRFLKSSEFKKEDYYFKYYGGLFPTPLSRELQKKFTRDLATIVDYTQPLSEMASDLDVMTISIASRTRILAMGLGDFLDFWNNHKSKNAEALFVPSSKEIKNNHSLGFSKKPKDKFYEYQQKFRDGKSEKKNKYRYQIQTSLD